MEFAETAQCHHTTAVGPILRIAIGEQREQARKNLHVEATLGCESTRRSAKRSTEIVFRVHGERRELLGRSVVAGIPRGEISKTLVVREHFDDRIVLELQAFEQSLDLEFLVPENERDDDTRLTRTCGAA